jgi:hypothetical protein
MIAVPGWYRTIEAVGPIAQVTQESHDAQNG